QNGTSSVQIKRKTVEVALDSSNQQFGFDFVQLGQVGVEQDLLSADQEDTMFDSLYRDEGRANFRHGLSAKHIACQREAFIFRPSSSFHSATSERLSHVGTHQHEQTATPTVPSVRSVEILRSQFGISRR